MSFPPFSPNAQALLQKANDEAIRRGHSSVLTEHLVFALLTCPTRAFNWIAMQSFPNESVQDAIPLFADSVRTYLESLVDFQPSPSSLSGDSGSDAPALPLSPAMQRVVDIATQIGSGPVRDGDHVHQDGLIASEFLLASLLVEGTGQGVEALTHLSSGAVDSQTLLAEIGVDPKQLRLPSPPPVAAALPADAADGAPPTTLPFDASALPDPDALPPPPTATSNWLIPHRLLIGEKPRRADLQSLAAAGIDTLVCLIGEYRNVGVYLAELGLPAAAAAAGGGGRGLRAWGPTDTTSPTSCRWQHRGRVGVVPDGRMARSMLSRRLLMAADADVKRGSS